MGVTKEEGNRILAYNGWFTGLDMIFRAHDVSREAGARAKANLFKLLLAKVLEARDEIGRLQNSAARLESLCRAGSISKPHEGRQVFTSEVRRTQAEMDTFDGWTISLLESDISLLMAIRNQESAAFRVNGLGKSFAKLFTRRVNDDFRMMKRFPEVFNMDVQF